MYHRYADPNTLLDNLILVGRLSEFIDVIREEKDEEMLWSLYLSEMIKEQSFTQWKASVTSKSNDTVQDGTMTKKEVETTIKQSQDMLSAFTPGREVEHGTF